MTEYIPRTEKPSLSHEIAELLKYEPRLLASEGNKICAHDAINFAASLMLLLKRDEYARQYLQLRRDFDDEPEDLSPPQAVTKPVEFLSDVPLFFARNNLITPVGINAPLVMLKYAPRGVRENALVWQGPMTGLLLSQFDNIHGAENHAKGMVVSRIFNSQDLTPALAHKSLETTDVESTLRPYHIDFSSPDVKNSSLVHLSFVRKFERTYYKDYLSFVQQLAQHHNPIMTHELLLYFAQNIQDAPPLDIQNLHFTIQDQ